MAFDEVEIAQRLTRIEHTLETLGNRLDKNDTLTQTIYEMSSTLTLMAEQNKNMETKIDAMEKRYSETAKRHGERIGALELKPAKRWDTAIAQIITLIIAAVVGGIISKLI